MTEKIYDAYVALENQDKFAISRDILDMWGQLDFTSDFRNIEAGVLQKLDFSTWDLNSDHSGYPSFDFVKSKILQVNKKTFGVAWAHFFQKVIESRTFVLENNPPLDTGLFLDRQSSKVLSEERYQNALIMLRSVIQKKGGSNMLNEIERLSALINNEQWPSFEVVVREFAESAKTKIPDLDEKLGQIRDESSATIPNEIEELEAQLEEVRNQLKNVEKDLLDKDLAIANQLSKIQVLETEAAESEDLFNSIGSYLSSSKFKGDNKKEIQKTVSGLMEPE